MDDENPCINCSGLRISRALARVVARQVEKWISREQSLLFLPKSATYRVHLARESGECVSCRIEVRIGRREWSGLEEGRSVQEAVLNTLRHLRTKHPSLHEPMQASA